MLDSDVVYTRFSILLSFGNLGRGVDGVVCDLDDVLMPPFPLTGQIAVATHFDAEDEGTRQRSARVPLSFRQRRRPADAAFSILVLCVA